MPWLRYPEFRHAARTIAPRVSEDYAHTVFFMGQVDIVESEGKVVRCKDDGTYWQCVEVKNSARSN